MTQLAMNVFPRPVGRATNVFLSKHARAITLWYSRSAYPGLTGSSQLPQVVIESGGNRNAFGPDMAKICSNQDRDSIHRALLCGSPLFRSIGRD